MRDDDDLRDAANAMVFIAILYACALVAMWVW